MATAQPAQMTKAQKTAQAKAANAQARALVAQNGVRMTQSIAAASIVPANQQTVNIAPRNVGLLTGFTVQITANITNSAGGTMTLTPYGPSNLLSNITFNDLNNNQRINTTGMHIALLNTVKAQRVWGSSVATDSPMKYGSNFSVISAPATIAASGTGTVVMEYFIPLAYSDQDFRGAIYANVVNATMNLALTFNPNALLASGDGTSAVYTGSAGTITNVTYNVYQHYVDQLPTDSKTGSVILPTLDLSTIYDLKYTTQTAIVANQEYPIQYSNFRDFLGTIVVYNNNATTAGLGVGADVNYWALQTANYTNTFKINPQLSATWTRNTIGTDLPAGGYYFNHRNKPISTIQYGNMELILNPTTAAAGAYALTFFESFAMIGAVSGAGSLAAN
jgi:hypothetical protein